MSAQEIAAPTWQECARAVQAVLNGAKFEEQDKAVACAVIVANLVSREEQMRPCKTCGAPRHDFSYWRVTAAGRMLVDALEGGRQS